MNGVKQKRKACRRLTKDLKREMLQMYHDNVKVEAICAKLDITRATIAYHVRKGGVTMRGRGGRKAVTHVMAVRVELPEMMTQLDAARFILLNPNRCRFTEAGYASKHDLTTTLSSPDTVVVKELK